MTNNWKYMTFLKADPQKTQGELGREKKKKRGDD